MVTPDAEANGQGGVVRSTAPDSPRLRELQAALETAPDRDGVLRVFWREVEETGTPLVEGQDSADGTVLVTFLWRGDPELEHVVVIEWMTQGDLADKRMTRLPHSDVWYRSVRVRHDVRTAYQLAPNDSLVPRHEERDWPARFARWQQDPLNRYPLIDPEVESDDEGRARASSVIELPGAPRQPWIERHPETPRGEVVHRRFTSDRLGNSRDVWIYHPAAGVGPDAPLLVAFDGERHLDVLRMPTVLDNVIASGRVPPFAAVMIGNVDRGAELPCNPDFLAMLQGELLPWLAGETGVKPEASRTVVAGASYGGLAAMYCGLFAPETFGLVLSQSGSFWWKPDPINEQTPLRIGDAGAYCWLPAQAAVMPIGDIRVWMEVGTLEDRARGGAGPSQLSANRHMRDVLIAKGVPVTYREYAGGHDYACWRNSLGDGLIELLGSR